MPASTITMPDGICGSPPNVAADWLQAYDGERSASFGGDLPDLYDQGDKAFVSLERDGAGVRGYDRSTETFYTATISDRIVQFYDHGEAAWYAFTVQTA